MNFHQIFVSLSPLEKIKYIMFLQVLIAGIKYATFFKNLRQGLMLPCAFSIFNTIIAIGGFGGIA